MQSDIKLFIIPKNRAPAGPPNPAREFKVEARSFDGLVDAARNQVAEEGYRLRSVSFGQGCLIIYAEEQT